MKKVKKEKGQVMVIRIHHNLAQSRQPVLSKLR